MNRRALRFAALLPALLVAHSVADHWLQTSHQASTKGRDGWPGRVACGKHVASYTATTAATVAVLDRTLGLGVSRRGLVAGQLVSAVSHYWADRRDPLRRLAERVNLGGFYRAGQPPFNTGAHALDQSWHWAWLGVAALVTAVMSDD